MSRFIKYIPSEAASWLRSNYPFAFLLLNLVAERARRLPNNPSGLGVAEAYIGDYDAIGASRQQYRTALKVLCSKNYLTILETNRTRKKSTNETTTKGTKVKLLNSDIWDVNFDDNNHLTNHCPTTAQPLPNHEQEAKQEELRRVKKESLAKAPAPAIANASFFGCLEKAPFPFPEKVKFNKYDEKIVEAALWFAERRKTLTVAFVHWGCQEKQRNLIFNTLWIQKEILDENPGLFDFIDFSGDFVKSNLPEDRGKEFSLQMHQEAFQCVFLDTFIYPRVSEATS